LQHSGLHQPQLAVSFGNSSGPKPRLKKIWRKLLHATHAKIQVVYDTHGARRSRPRLPKCTTRNRELGPVFIDEAVTGFADSKSLADEINILLGQKIAAHLRHPLSSSRLRHPTRQRVEIDGIAA